MKRSIALALLGASLTASMAQSPENLDLIYTTDSSFIFASQIPLNWDGATAFAESLGGHLATFQDVNENNAVQAELSSFNTVDVWSYWFGLVQDSDGAEPNGGWQWVTGEPLNFLNWNPDAMNEYEGFTGEPNNVGGSEDCGEYRFDGTWNDNPCSADRFFLVELPKILGCTNDSACNFDASANLDDGSCVSCDIAASFCGVGTVWDAESQSCIGDQSGDINLDGCVQLNDLLDLLSAYGDCGAEESVWLCGDPLEYQGYNYNTVQIGEQCWFAENLRAENYANGDAILDELDDNTWSYTQEGATTIYGADEGCQEVFPAYDACDPVVSLAFFGRLYNWFAVNDARKVCPTGWSIPSNNDVDDLLLHFPDASGLKSTDG